MGRWVEDEDVEMGNVEIGEALRGQQDTAYVGAAALKGALAQLAGQRFNPHAPIQKKLRSPYKDSTQIGIVTTTGTLSYGASFTLANPAQVSGVTRVYKSFKPAKVIVTETVQVTFPAVSGGGSTTVYYSPVAANDLLLISAFAGADNCFPNAPNTSNGINCASMSPSTLGNGISWPTINGGIDMTVGFAIRPSIFGLGGAAIPSGTTLVGATAIVTIDMSIWGPSLR